MIAMYLPAPRDAAMLALQLRYRDFEPFHARSAARAKTRAPVGRRRDACPRGTRAHPNETRCKRRDGAWAGGNEREPQTKPQAMGGREVAALFLRI